MKPKELTNRWNSDEFLRKNHTELSALLLQKSRAVDLDIRGLILGLDGQPEVFKNGDLIEAKAIGLNADYCAFAVNFSGSDISKSTFRHAKFDTCRMIRCKFNDVAFDSARLNSPTLDDAEIRGCSFVKTKIHGRRIQSYGGRRIIFEDCDFSECVFKNLKFIATRFKNCKFDGAIFEICSLAGVKFEECGVDSDHFQSCDIKSLSFDGVSVNFPQPGNWDDKARKIMERNGLDPDA